MERKKEKKVFIFVGKEEEMLHSLLLTEIVAQQEGDSYAYVDQ